MGGDTGHVQPVANSGGGEKGLVDAGALYQGDPLRTIKHLRIGIEISAGTDHIIVWVLVKFQQGIHAVGQDRHVDIRWKVAGQVLGRGAAVNRHDVVRLDQRCGLAADPLL